MKYPTTRFVFDRKNTSTKSRDALVQVEILFERKKKYVTTGVRVYRDQWSDRQRIVRREDAVQLNGRIDAVKNPIDDFITSLMRDGVAFTWDRLSAFLSREAVKEQSFVEYVAERIAERNDIRESTRKSHAKILSSLDDFGRLRSFDDLTRANIAAYYDWLLGREIVKIGRDGKEYRTKMAVQTVASYMKILRTYIRDAIVHERIDRDPSVGVKVKRGETMDSRWLTEEELSRIENAELSSGSLVRVRDLFVFMCYSGLAFSDLMDFNAEKIEDDGNGMMLVGRRKKTGQEYVVLILPKAREILEKYAYRLPRYTNQQFNHRLKELAAEAGVNRRISSHFGRHTAAMTFLNSGVRLETVSRILGHSSTKITESVYASVLKKTVAEEMKALG